MRENGADVARQQLEHHPFGGFEGPVRGGEEDVQPTPGLAMGHDAVTAHGSVRLTLGRENGDEDVDYFLEVFPGVVEQLRAMSPLYAKG